MPPGKRLAAFSKWIPDYIHNTVIAAPAAYARPSAVTHPSPAKYISPGFTSHFRVNKPERPRASALPVVTDRESLSQSITESEEEQTSQSSGHERHRAGLGALQVDSHRYVQPSEAVRSKDYECMECGEKVILKRGEI